MHGCGDAFDLTNCRLPNGKCNLEGAANKKREKQPDKTCHLNNFQVSLMFRLQGLVEKERFWYRESLRGKLE